MCFWEDDGQSDDDAASVDGPNGMTLAEGQRRYMRYGSSTLQGRAMARPPTPDEVRDPNWQPVPRPVDEDERQFFWSDFGELLWD